MASTKAIIRNIARQHGIKSLSSPHTRILRESINPALTNRLPQRALSDIPPNIHREPTNPDPRTNPAHSVALPNGTNVGRRRFADFDLKGRVMLVTGGGRGLGLALAEGLVEAGGKVYCLDRLPKPDDAWEQAKRRMVPEWGGSLHYRQVDVSNTEELNSLVGAIADEHGRLDGLVAAAAIQQITPAVEYAPEDVELMLSINYTAMLMTAQAAAKQMFKYKCHGSICFIGSMSGTVANKGLLSPVYNSSKAAVIQLARNLAMEWTPVKPDGTGGIRVNCLSPGHILTPMVRKNFEEVPGLREKWEGENMMGRLADTTEFKSAALFLISRASSFMTGGNLIVDGGHTAW